MSMFMLLASEGDPLSHVLDHDWGLPLGLTKHVVTMIGASALCVLTMTVVARRVAGGETGGRLAGLFEVLLCFVRDEIAIPFLGEEDSRKFLPFIWTLFFFILFINVLGLLPGNGTATGNLSVTLALALIAFVTYHTVGIKRNGFVHYVKANLLVGPAYLWPLMIPIEFMGQLIRPGALAIRLFANMMGGHTMLAVFASFCLVFTSEFLLGGGAIALISVAASVAIMFLEILVAFLQAFIFTFLTTVFLSLAIHPEH